MLLITERILNTGGSLRREDPPAHSNLSQIPDMTASNVRQSQFLFVFQQNELPQLNDILKQKLGNQVAGTKHIIDVIAHLEHPTAGWNHTKLIFPSILRKTKDQFIHFYLSHKQPVNCIVATNIPTNSLLSITLKDQGQTIGNHCIHKLYEQLIIYASKYVDSLAPDQHTDMKKLLLCISKFRSNWDTFEIENLNNDYFSSRMFSTSKQKLQIFQNRVSQEISTLTTAPRWDWKWWFEKVPLVIIVGVLTGLILFVIQHFVQVMFFSNVIPQ